jgi:hypothetical protein
VTIDLAIYIGIGITVGGWLFFAIHAAQLAFAHPAEGRSALWYAFHGDAFLSPGNFAPSGLPIHRRMTVGVVVFFLGAAITGICTLWAA